MKRLLAFLVLVAVSPESVRADEVMLKNGARLEGVVRDEGTTIRIEMDFGSITLKKTEVAAISRVPLPLHDFESRWQTVQGVQAKLELARWAEAHGLPGRARRVYEDLLLQDPNQPEARRVLGFTYHDGRWLDPDELKAAQGMIRMDGRWMTPGEYSQWQIRELDRRRAELELAREEEDLARRRDAEAERLLHLRAQADYLRLIAPSVQNTTWVPVPWGTLPWSPYRYPFYTGYPPGAVPPPP
jgi:hypothetical protein